MYAVENQQPSKRILETETMRSGSRASATTNGDTTGFTTPP
jgi:hypothetical protein